MLSVVMQSVDVSLHITSKEVTEILLKCEVALHLLICFPISLEQGFPDLQTLGYMYPRGHFSTFQGVHYNQNLNCRGDALTPNCGTFFFFWSSIEFRKKNPF